MKMYRFLQIINGYRFVVAFVIFVALVGAIAASFLLPKKFVAESSLLITVSRVDPKDGRLVAEQRVPEYFATQQDLLKSMAVAQAVVRDIGSNSSKWHQAWLKSTGGVGDFTRWQAGQLLKSFELVMSPESNLIVLHYKAADPQRAALILNSWVKAYIVVHDNIRSPADKSWITVISHEGVPAVAANSTLLLNLVIGGLFGIAMAIPLALLLEMWHPRIRSARDVEDFLDMPLLAVVNK